MSTSTIASLVVQLEANVARFSTDIKSAADQTQRAMSSIESAASLAKTALGALAGAFSVAEVAAYAKGAIAAAASLDDLAESTGSSVEALSELKNRMAVSGVDGATFTTLMNKLAVGLSGVDEESSKAAAALAAMGISTKDPAEALKQLAEKMGYYADGVDKAALLQAIFGKGGAQYVGILKDIARETQTAGSVTAEFAAAAEDFEKSINRGKIATEAWANAILSDLIPAMTRLMEMTRGGGVSGFFAAIGLTDKDVADADRALKETQTKIAELTAARNQLSVPTLTNKVNAFLFGDIGDIDRQLAVLTEREKALLAVTQEITRKIAEATADKPNAPKAGGGASPATAQAKQAVADYADEIQRLNDLMFKSAGSGGGWDNMIRANEKLQADVKAGKAINTEQARQYMLTAVAADQQAQAQAALKVQIEEATKAREAEIAALQKNADASTSALASFYEGNQALEREIELIGADDTARQKMAATMEYEAAKRKAIVAENVAEVAILDELYQKRLQLIDQAAQKTSTVEAAKEYAREWSNAIQSVTSGLSNFFVDLATNGKSAFSRLWDNFKNYALRALADIAARQIVVSVLGAVGLTGASSAMAGVSGGSNLLGMAGMAGGIGNSASYLGTSLGIAASGGGLLGTTGAASGYLGAGMGGWVSAEGGASLMGGGLIESLGLSLGAATLAIAGIGLAAYFIADALDTSGEAVERFGTWISSVSDKLPRGNTLFQSSSAFGGFGIVDDFRFSDADMGESMKKFLAGIAEVDNAIAAAVGPDVTKQISENLAAVTETFSAGMEHGAISFGEIVRTRYTVALNTIHDGLGDLIKNFQGTDAELGTFAARVAGIWTALKKIDTETVTQLGLTDDAFLALAGASDELLTTFNALVTAFQYVSDLADPIAEAMDGMGTDWEKLIKQGDRLGTMAAYFDGSATSATNLANATRDYYAATVQMISAIEQIKKSVADLFNSNIRTFTMSGMTNEEQYGFLQSEVNTWMAELKSATDPSRINWLASSIAQNQSTAWGLLSPEQQQQAKQQFIDGANAANAVVQERLAAAEKAANDRYQTFLADVKDVLSEAVTKLVADAQTAADKQVAAADAQVAAANTQLVAAETPHVIYVNDQSQGASAAVGSY